MVGGVGVGECTGPSADFRASCMYVRVACVCVKCVWAASMSAVGCPVARLVPSASVTASGGPSSQVLGLALGLLCPGRASMSWVLCVVVSYSPPSRVPMCGLTETHWVGWPSLLMM